jgi:hypothetical protein
VKLRNTLQLLAASAIALSLVACSVGTGSNPLVNPIMVSFLTTPATSVDTGASTGLTAIVSNDANNAGVTWKVTCGSASCGSISPKSTASGVSAVYTAPGTVPTPAAVTVTATSVTDSTKSISASIVVVAAGPPPPISVSFVANPPSPIVINTTASIAASVSNDSKNAGVTWTVSCGSAQCGTFNPTSTASGVSTTYTAPAAVPSPATVTITATSVTDNTKATFATVTVAATPPPILSDGTYVFHFSGQDNNGPYYVAGAFAVKSGIITGGEQDFTDPVLGSTDALVASNCSLTAAGNKISVILATANNQIGVSGSEVLHGTKVSSSRVLVSEFDSFAAATGSIDLQTSTAAPSGGYAFAINGWDATAEANQLVIGGVLNFSGSTLSVANSVFDLNDGNGTILQAQSFASGAITAPDFFGRITISLVPSVLSGVPNINLTGYLVDGSKMQLLESQADTLNADLGGVALAQGNHTFSQATVVNSTYVHGSSGEDTNGFVALGGAFTFAPGGVASGLLAFNDLVNTTGNSFSGATYVVDPTGRVTISNIVPSNMSNVSLSFQLYLDGNGNALTLGIDGIQQTSGLAYQQNGLADYEGTYAVEAVGFLNGVNGEQAYGAAGPTTISSDTFNGSTDYTAQQNYVPAPFVTFANTPLTGLEDNSRGLLNLTGLNALSFTQPSAFGYYPIDGNRVLGVEVDHNAMGLLMLESSTPSN